jgi:hypothetical protein
MQRATQKNLRSARSIKAETWRNERRKQKGRR